MTKIDTGRDERLIAALVSGASHAEAAQACGMSRSTLQRRFRSAEFRKQFDEAVRHWFNAALAASAANAVRAGVNVLTAVALDGEAPHAARVSAASRLLEVAQRFREGTELADRLAALEARLDAQAEGE